MKRLTEQIKHSCFRYRQTCILSNGKYKEIDSGSFRYQNYETFYAHSISVMKLGEYEDTGLEPNQIEELRKLATEWRTRANSAEMWFNSLLRVLEMKNEYFNERMKIAMDMKSTETDKDKLLLLHYEIYTCEQQIKWITQITDLMSVVME